MEEKILLKIGGKRAIIGGEKVIRFHDIHSLLGVEVKRSADGDLIGSSKHGEELSLFESIELEDGLALSLVWFQLKKPRVLLYKISTFQINYNGADLGEECIEEIRRRYAEWERVNLVDRIKRLPKAAVSRIGM